MNDTIIKGTGNSRTLKTTADLPATYEGFRTKFIEGTLPVDIGALVAAGVQQQGMTLTKANLLADATATALGLTSAATPNDALSALNSLIKDNPYLWNGSKKLGSLPAGALVKLNEDGQAKKFIVLGKDHYGTGTGVTLIRKDAFSEIAWNASDNGAYKNRYFGCTMDNFCDGIWPLKLDEEIRECMVPVPIIVAEGDNVSTLHTIYRKGFALSCTEVGVNGWQTEGTAFSYFSDNDKRIANLDGTETAVDWGLRSPYSNALGAYRILAAGTVFSYVVDCAYFAPRPAFNLKSDMVISSGVDSDGCYTFVKKGGT